MHFPCSIASARKFVENIVLPLTKAACQIQTWCEWAQLDWFQWRCAHSHQACNWPIVLQRLSLSKMCQSADKQILQVQRAFSGSTLIFTALSRHKLLLAEFSLWLYQLSNLQNENPWVLSTPSHLQNC